MRVYHVARESGYASRVLLQMLHARGVDLPSHMAPLSEPEATVLAECVTALRSGAPIAPPPAAAAAAARPGAAAATTAVEDARTRKRRPEEEVRKPGTSKKRKGRDEKMAELSEELLQEGFAEVLEHDPTALPGAGLTPPRAEAPAAAPTAPVPAPMPTRPHRTGPARGPTRFDQRRTPRTLVRQRRRGKSEPTLAQGKIAVEVPISVKALSQIISVPANGIIRTLMQSGNMVNINSSLDGETVQVLALEFNRDIELKQPRPAVEQILEDLELDIQDETRAEPRPAVVAVLGHVDHGKTSLLDAIRRTNVAAGEAGGITQHIGAYQVVTEGGRLVTFLDTPGHEAFTEMRARGANVADICVLVVAADDGVMPQTEEAINHSRAAGVPIVVALNKIDKAGSNRDRILNQLSTLGLVWDKWGGDTLIEPVSATTGEGVAHLVEMLALTADLQELSADPHRRGVGTVLEASKSEARGVLATLLVQAGTLRLGDIVLAGAAYGRIRGLYNDRGEDIDEAPPALPVQVTGLSDVPEAGARFYVLDDLSAAKSIAENRAKSDRASGRTERPMVTLENAFGAVAADEKLEIRVVLKADVKGSVEAIEKKITGLATEEISVRVLHSAVGAVTESDIKLAVASRAVVIGFNVLVETGAQALAEHDGVQVRTYRIIYEVEDDVKRAMEGLLAPEKREEVLGHATIKELFHISKVGTIAGCSVTDGLIRRSAAVRLYRDGRLIVPEARLANLKRFKDDVREVKSGFECGMKVDGYDDIKLGDVIESYEVVEVKRTLE